MKQYASYENYLRKCIRCSFCQPVCPIFSELREEGVIARAKVRLAREFSTGKLTPSPRLKEIFSLCLDCRACESVCPARVPIHEIVKNMRDALQMTAGSGKGLYKSAALLLTRPRLVRTLAALAVHVNPTSKRLKAPKLVQMLAPIVGRAHQVLPPLHKLPFNIASRSKPMSLSAGITIGYFVGCATNYFYPETARAVAKVLNKNDLRIFVPSVTICCGLPVFNGGETEAARKLADKVLAQFNDPKINAIVTDCAGCSLHLREYAKHWPDLPGVQEFSAKVIDVTALLVQHGFSSGPLPVAKKVTYHDPCHLARAQNIREEPRQILSKINGLELVEMKESDRCCGGSGLFSIMHPELSDRILDRKLSDIKGTGSGVVATACPSCRIQLERGIVTKHVVEVVHPIELLAQTWPEELFLKLNK